mmetsp:Transcript_29836/g.41255  ORF Transcript_29836/g.41255 Transcript_29836/m.41255 type:complete len:277 (-) Transcript_29836:256-1086(-)
MYRNQLQPPNLQFNSAAIPVSQSLTTSYVNPYTHNVAPAPAPYNASGNQVQAYPAYPTTSTPSPASGPVSHPPPSIPPPASSSEVSNTDRWNVVFTAVRAYYLFDATKSFLGALVGMITTLVAFLVMGKGDCGVPMWVPSMLIFVTRCLDVGCGCGTICFRLCCSLSNNKSGDPQNSRKQEFGNFAIQNLYICVAQIILGIVQIVMAVLGLTSDTEDCASSLLTAVFAILFILDAGQELLVWGICFYMYKYQDNVKLPGWFDCLFPACMRDIAAKI